MANPATNNGEFDLNILNSEFPCDQRVGYGFKGCKCGGTGHGEESRKYVECRVYEPQIQWQQCLQCPYQQRYVKNI